MKVLVGSIRWLVMIWGLVCGPLLVEGLWALSPEVEELKRILKEVVAENRRLAERVSELERRLAAYEKKSPKKVETFREKPWYERIEVGLLAAGLFQSAIGVDKELANLHAHGGREPAGRADMIMHDENKAYAAAAVDLSFSAEFSDRERAYVLLEMGSGKNPESEIPSFSGIVDEALSMVPVETDDGDVRVSEAWFEREWPLGNGRFRFRFGKIDITTEVDQNTYASDENAQFMSPAFVNNPAVEWASYSFGVAASYETENWALTLGYEDADSGWDNLFDYPFLVAQFALSPRLFGRPGNYRFYVWYQGEKHLSWEELEDYLAGKISRPENEDPAWGFGVSFDQELMEGLGMFLRYGYRGNDLVGYAYYDENGFFDLHATDFSYGFDEVLTAGLSVSGEFWGRPGDEIGLGLAVFFLREEYRDYWEGKGVYASRLNGDPLERSLRTENEYHFEIYYRFQLHESLALTPDFQYTWNPADLGDDGFWVFSLRGVWEY